MEKHRVFRVLTIVQIRRNIYDITYKIGVKYAVSN